MAIKKVLIGDPTATPPKHETIAAGDRPGDLDGVMLDTVPPQVVTVAPAGAMFTSVKVACDSITDSGPTKPYFVRVSPGVYDEAPFSLPPYTQILGTGWFHTILRAADPDSHFITLWRGSVLRCVCVYGPTAVGQAAIHHDLSSLEAPSVIEVAIGMQSHYGILSDPSVSRGTLLLSTLYSLNAGPGAVTQQFLCCAGFADVMAQALIVAGAANTILKGFVAEGANAKLTAVNSMFEVAGATDAMYVNNGATIQTIACVLTTGQNAIRVGPDGASHVTSEALKIRNAVGIGFTKDILIESALAEVHVDGMMSLSRVDNTVGAVKFSACGVNIDVVAGTPVGGEFVIGTSLLVGSGDYPRHTFPPYAIFDFPKAYFERRVNSISGIIPGYGNRTTFNRLIMNPPGDTTERGWGMQCGSDVATGCNANFGCGVAGHPDLMGVEGTVNHNGNGLVDMASGLMGYVFTGGHASIGEAISSYAFQPTAGGPDNVIDKAYCFKARAQSGSGTVNKKFSFVSEDGCGNGGIGYDEPVAAWAVKDGISAGRNEDPGTGVVHAEAGFKTRDGAVTRAGVSGSFTTTDGKTITIVNGIVTSIV
jgi:hypothetical protein